MLVGNTTNEFYLLSILSAKTRNIFLAFLIGAFGLETAQNVLFADEQSATEKRNGSINSEGISSNPGAVDIRTGTGELAQTVENFLDLPRDTGVFLGGVWVGDTNGLLSGGAEPGKWSFNSLLIVGAGLDAEKLVGLKGVFAVRWSAYQRTSGQRARLQFSARPEAASSFRALSALVETGTFG